MFCPNCGNRSGSEQKFCRNCGLDLERSAESMHEQLPTADRAAVLRKERQLEKFGDFAWNSFALTVLFAIGNLIAHVFAGFQIWYEGILAALIVFASLGIAHRVIDQRRQLRKRAERQIAMTLVSQDSLEATDLGSEGTTRELELRTGPSVH